jgi:3-oxoadipate enol-lactonase
MSTTFVSPIAPFISLSLMAALPLAQAQQREAAGYMATGAQEISTGSTVSYVTLGDGERLAYRIDGPAGKPLLVLANSIGTTLHMWDEQIPGLTQHFRVLRYDMRGHGASSVPAGAYSLDRFGRDVLELLDALHIEQAHFLGLSLGGFVGQWLGIHAPERIDRLILSNTAAWLGPTAQWDAAIETVRQARDMREITEGFLRNWFPVHMLEADTPAVQKFRHMLLATSAAGLAGSYALVRDTDLRRANTLITNPTLVIVGEHDTVTSASHGEAIAAAIPGATLQRLSAVHLANVEFPAEFLRLVLTFLLTPGEPTVRARQ